MPRIAFIVLVSFVWASDALATPAYVIIIRHAEKEDGNELSQKGRERAAALVPYFLGRPEIVAYKTPVAIYAQGQKKEESSLRPVQTVKPLAEALKLKLIDKYTRDEFKKMVDEVLSSPDYDGKTVVICWEHKVIPMMAKAFGAESVPEEWHGKHFDRTWVIALKGQDKPSLKVLPQMLMYGDAGN
jgi:hypothetical protein